MQDKSPTCAHGPLPQIIQLKTIHDNELVRGLFTLRIATGTFSLGSDRFRSLEGNLGMGPNLHQIERRVEGHIWIRIMGYHLLCWIQGMLKKGGDHRRWSTIKRVLQTHSYTTIVVPTKGGKTFRIRKAGEPEELQKTVYDKLKVNWKELPKTKLEVQTTTTL